MLSRYQHRELSDTSSITSEVDTFDNSTDKSSKNLPKNNPSYNNDAIWSGHENIKITTKIPSVKGLSKIPEIKQKNPIRRKSKQEKYEELNELKIEAMNQVENTIRITDLIKDRGSKLVDLQMENDRLRQELKSLQFQLDESKSVNAELVERLHVVSDEKTRRRIESENRRTRDLVDMTLGPKAGYEHYLQDVLSSRDRLKDQNNQLATELEQSTNQVKSLKERVFYLESLSDPTMLYDQAMDKSVVDARSKSELLRLIRDNIDDKIIWMEYAIKLTQRAVCIAPDLLRIDRHALSADETAQHCCPSEPKWAAFAISLLREVNRVNPTLIQSLVDSQNAVPSNLLITKLGGMSGSAWGGL